VIVENKPMVAPVAMAIGAIAPFAGFVLWANWMPIGMD
jgi:hypothetical protein